MSMQCRCSSVREKVQEKGVNAIGLFYSASFFLFFDASNGNVAF